MAKGPLKNPSAQQAASWLYVVIAPTLNGLKQEAFFLARRAPTWRYRLGRCEFLNPVAAYAEAGQQPTVSQFLRFNPKLLARVKEHDSGVSDLSEIASEAHAGLVRLPALQALTSVIEADFPGWKGGLAASEGAKLLAEHIIDFAGVQELGSHYLSAAAWSARGAEALRLRADPSVAPCFERLERALTSLSESVQQLTTRLERVRDELADEHGLPPVQLHQPELYETFETF